MPGFEESIHLVTSVLLHKWDKFHGPLQVYYAFYLYHKHLVYNSGAAGTGDVTHCTNIILFKQWENKLYSLGFFDQFKTIRLEIPDNPVCTGDERLLKK